MQLDLEVAANAAVFKNFTGVSPVAGCCILARLSELSPFTTSLTYILRLHTTANILSSTHQQHASCRSLA